MKWILVAPAILSSTAMAQSSGAATPSFLTQAFPFIALFFIFYFLILRPQTKKQKALAEFNAAMKKGDEVLTSSGIFGTIEGLTDKYVTLEIADNVRIRILRSMVNSSVKKEVKK